MLAQNRGESEMEAGNLHSRTYTGELKLRNKEFQREDLLKVWTNSGLHNSKPLRVFFRATKTYGHPNSLGSH